MKRQRVARWGHIYVLQNGIARDVLKIGRTKNFSWSRAEQLSGATFGNWFVVYSALCDDAARAERKIHNELRDRRWSKSQEIFIFNVHQAVAKIRSLGLELRETDYKQDAPTDGFTTSVESALDRHRWNRRARVLWKKQRDAFGDQELDAYCKSVVRDKATDALMAELKAFFERGADPWLEAPYSALSKLSLAHVHWRAISSTLMTEYLTANYSVRPE